MSWESLDGLLWLLASLLPFLWIQRWLHREIQAVFLILARRPELALGLFSLLFFPGVFLHETSHFLAARLLGVRTGKFSLLPHMLPDGHLRMGFVETAQVDLVRDALVGSAPLLAGGLVVAFLGVYPLGFSGLASKISQGDWLAFWQGMKALPGQPDFWLWFYLAFAISSTMLPSEADRQAWLPVLVGIGVLVGLAVLAGAGSWMVENLAPWVDKVLRAVALVFSTSLAVHVVLGIPVSLSHRGLTRLTGLDVR